MISKFSERLKDLRQEKEISYVRLAKETGISQNAFAHWEKERRVPNANAIITLALYFGVTADYILGITND